MTCPNDKPMKILDENPWQIHWICYGCDITTIENKETENDT